MAKCQFCDLEMLEAEGCTFSKIVLRDGRKANRRKVGKEGCYSPGERCRDCGARFGSFHHFGCDQEICPVCGIQQISCDCEIGFLEC